jgi:hypothetical protein
MSFLKRITRSNFVIKLRSWEYWPFGIVQFPIFFYFLWLALRTRSLLFFTASNPGIPMGGMFGESKFEILKKIPTQYIPRTIRITLPATTQSVLEELGKSDLRFPLVFKPDLGERGFMVKKITTITEIELYLKKIRIDFIVQDFVDLPLEFGIFYARIPDQHGGTVTSIVKKEMLSVTGDGVSTLKQLIFKNDRAKLQWKKLEESHHDRLEEIVPEGEVMEIVSIGNHARGTKFLDGNNLITDKLSSVFDTISKQIEGFYFGRFDIRCASLEDLYKGKIKIMELNGCGAEPAHIYDPDFKLRNAIAVLFKHWYTIFRISRQNHKQGFQYLSMREGLTYYKKFKNATR